MVTLLLCDMNAYTMNDQSLSHKNSFSTCRDKAVCINHNQSHIGGSIIQKGHFFSQSKTSKSDKKNAP